MKNSIKKNYFYNLGYQILTLILPLITTPYISQVLGAENIGIYSYTISISTYFILLGSLGIALYGQRQIAYEQGKSETYSKTFWEIVILRFITMSISMLIFYFAFVNGEQYQIYYKILFFELLANCLDISWFFQGLEEFKKIVVRNTIIKIISIISVFSFIKTQNDLIKYFWIYVLSILLGNISLWTQLHKYLKKIKLKQLNILQHVKPTIALLVPQIAIQIHAVLDKTMLGTIISNKTEVGWYEQAQKIITVLLTVVTSLTTVMLPRISNVYISGKKEELNRYMKKSFCFMFALSLPMIFGVLLVANEFVPLFFGQGYDKVIILMKLLTPFLLLVGISGVIGTQYLLPTQRQREYTTSVIIGAIANVIISLLLIKKYKSIGVSIGTVSAELIIVIFQFYCIRNDFDIKEIVLTAKNYLIASIIMYFTCLPLNGLIHNSIYLLLSKVILGTIIYGVTLIILKDDIVKEIIEKIRGKMK